MRGYCIGLIRRLQASTNRARKRKFFGLGIIQELARHGYKLSPGTLYPILHGLEENGQLRSYSQGLAGKIRRCVSSYDSEPVKEP